MKAIHEPVLLSWKSRVLLLIVAAGATLVYAASFLALPESVRDEIPLIAAKIALAATLSWPIFGAWLLLLTPGPTEKPAYRWADICLRTMVCGNAVLGSAVLLNLSFAALNFWSFRWGILAHLAILASANLTMASCFRHAAQAIGTTSRAALLAWFGGLNLPFILILLLLCNFI